MTDKLARWGEESRGAQGQRDNNSNNAEAEQEKMTKNGLNEPGRRLAGICPQLRMNTRVEQWGEGGGLVRSVMSSQPSGPACQSSSESCINCHF